MKKCSVLFSGRTDKAVSQYETFSKLFGDADYYISCCPNTAKNIDATVEVYKPKGLCTDSIPFSSNVECMFFNRTRAFNMIKEPTDIIVSTRFDVCIAEPIIFPEVLEDNTVYIPQGEDHCGGINDRLAYGNYESMKKYCSTVVEENNHPESALRIYIEKVGLHVVRFENDTSFILR